MSRKKYSTRSRILVVLAFFAVALIIVGLVLRTRIGMLLQTYTESQTKKQAEAYAMLMEEKLNTELTTCLTILIPVLKRQWLS